MVENYCWIFGCTTQHCRIKVSPTVCTHLTGIPENPAQPEASRAKSFVFHLFQKPSILYAPIKEVLAHWAGSLVGLDTGLLFCILCQSSTR